LHGYSSTYVNCGSDLPDFGGHSNLIASHLSKIGEIVEEHLPN